MNSEYSVNFVSLECTNTVLVTMVMPVHSINEKYTVVASFVALA